VKGQRVKLKRLALPVLLVAGAAAGWLWWSRPVAVDVVEVRRGSAAEVVYATGVVEPVSWAKVTPAVRARLAWHCNCEGETVRTGHVLARLDESTLLAELSQAQARRDWLSAEMNRQTDLVGRGTTSRVSLERTQTELIQAEGAVAALQARRSDFVLVAPMDGVVLRADGHVGEIAGTVEPLFWVGPPRPLRVVADVNEEDIPRVATGQKTLLRNDGFIDRVLDAHVADITPKGDPVTKTFRVYLGLPADTPLRIGMSVEANIVLREKADALLVPADALREDHVQVLRGEQVESVPVRVGIRGTRGVEILEGLAAGERVLSPARPDLRRQARVVARLRTLPAASRP
jgi:RND family efflux transporter MFP subunit